MAFRDRDTFEDALLGLLHTGATHGYEICRHFDPGGGWAGVGALPRSQVYALLKSLERQGYAAAWLEEGQGGPARRVYEPTPAGRTRFLSWVRRPVCSVRGLRVEFPLKLYFYRELGLPGLDDLFDAQEAVLRRRRAEVRRGRASAVTVAGWVFELQEGLLDAGLDWLRRRRAEGTAIR